MTNKQYRNRVAKIEALQEQVDALNEQIKKVKGEIMLALGDEEEKDLGDRHIFWKWKKASESFDTARFRKEHPEMVPDYIKVGKPTRSFLITAPKKVTA